MSAITTKTIELAAKLSVGECGIQGTIAYIDKESDTHLERYLLPTAISAALYFSTKVPFSTTSRLAHTFSHIVGPFVYTSIKDKALEQYQIPDPIQEIRDGTLGGAAVGTVDCMLRRIRPFRANPGSLSYPPIPGFFSQPRGLSCPPGFFHCSPPKLLPSAIRGGVAGAGLVLGSLIVDKWIH